MDKNQIEEIVKKECIYCKNHTIENLPIISNCDILSERFLTLIADMGNGCKEIVIHHKDKTFGIPISYCPICGRKLK